jgi:hypothetical protein
LTSRDGRIPFDLRHMLSVVSLQMLSPRAAAEQIEPPSLTGCGETGAALSIGGVGRTEHYE